MLLKTNGDFGTFHVYENTAINGEVSQPSPKTDRWRWMVALSSDRREIVGTGQMPTEAIQNAKDHGEENPL